MTVGGGIERVRKISFNLMKLPVRRRREAIPGGESGKSEAAAIPSDGRCPSRLKANEEALVEREKGKLRVEKQ